MNGRNGEVSGLDLPHLDGVEPDVGLEGMFAAVVGLRFVDDVLFQERSVRVQILIGESRADLVMQNIELIQ